jgi:hypothetical protein
VLVMISSLTTFPGGLSMNPLGYSFARQFIGVVVAALIPVVLVAFLCIPFILGGHPGEPRALSPQASSHMT